MGSIFLHHRFFVAGGVCIILSFLFFFADFNPSVNYFSWGTLFSLLVLDITLHFFGNFTIVASRTHEERFSLNSENSVSIHIHNISKYQIKCIIYDDCPSEFQMRDISFEISLLGKEEASLTYMLKPLKRGIYIFGSLYIYTISPLGFIKYRRIFTNKTQFKVWPSIVYLKEIERMAFSKIQMNEGIKKIRKIGHNYEFEQIKNYVRGDDFRSINWKATGKRNQLMVNHYQDERSQNVLFVIDKSRKMLTQFQGLRLIDYAINATFALSNIIIKSHDKAGLFTYSNKMGSFLSPSNSIEQLSRISSELFKQLGYLEEPSIESAYQMVSSKLKQRSLLIWFTNIESKKGLEAHLPIFKALQKKHILVVVFFQDPELLAYSQAPVDTTSEVYGATYARELLQQQLLFTKELNKYKIQTLLTSPESIGISLLNKYQELKARGLI